MVVYIYTGLYSGASIKKDQGILALFLRRQKVLKTLIENFGNVNQFNLDWMLALFYVNVCCISYISCFFDITVTLSMHHPIK